MVFNVAWSFLPTCPHLLHRYLLQLHQIQMYLGKMVTRRSHCTSSLEISSLFFHFLGAVRGTIEDVIAATGGAK